ncbi:Malate/lactate dehydrogenase [Caloramator fervidus]|uniref:Malate/lactate dehydrogenase n=1 Tax=Caloramator fervidus TaxID=29344 RepID=A0A1H5X0Y3_9CLOT|nr:lactate dehydrogenase [Caloramator fervidus]SEG04906.1 Malate/lactate dehydrogenase [Caloramator fervidus]
MKYYKFEDKAIISFENINFNTSNQIECLEKDKIYFVGKMPKGKSRRSFVVTLPDEIFMQEEDIEILNIKNTEISLPPALLYKIAQRKMIYVNSNYPNWQDIFNYKPKYKHINIIGLGDVGGTLLTGLRLLGKNIIQSIGIYDKDENKMNRWFYEANQIFQPFSKDEYPEIKKISEEDIFNCDILAFCVSVYVPGLNEKGDVRMLQFESNSKIVSEIAKKARKNNFKGILAIISDPVDLLCKVAFLESNKDENGKLDYKGLYPEQIIGFGLGVMNARANFYSKTIEGAEVYKDEGRVFGPHGKDIVVANSIKNYNDEISKKLTEKVKNANIDIRNTGFKPFIAPALSSGALSILSMIKGEWFYGSTFIGGVYFGCKMKIIDGFIEVERNFLDIKLLERLKESYKKLGEII